MAQRCRPWLIREIGRALYQLVYPNARLMGQIPDLTEPALHQTFDTVADRQRHRGYFSTEQEFRNWMKAMALRAAMEGLLRHPRVEPWLLHLSSDHRRLLVMMWLDQLSLGDIAGVLGTTQDDVRQRRQGAYHTFFGLSALPEFEPRSRPLRPVVSRGSSQALPS